MRKLHADFGRREAPSATYICHLVKKVKETSILINKPKREEPKTVPTPKNIAGVAESMREAPFTSIHRRSLPLNISERSLRRILHKELKLSQLTIQRVFASLRGPAIILQMNTILAKINHLFR